VVEKPAFCVQASGEACQLSVGPDNAVTRKHDRERISPVGRSNGTNSSWASDLCGLLAVCRSFAIGDIGQRHPHLLLEIGATQLERQVKTAPVASKVLIELISRAAKNIVASGRWFDRELDATLALFGPQDSYERRVGCDEPELADRAIDLCA